MKCFDGENAQPAVAAQTPCILSWFHRVGPWPRPPPWGRKTAQNSIYTKVPRGKMRGQSMRGSGTLRCGLLGCPAGSGQECGTRAVTQQRDLLVPPTPQG